MRKVLAILLVCIYTSLTVVSFVSLHFCHGHLKTITFSKTDANRGCNDHAKCSSSCCQNILISIDFEPDQSSAESFQYARIQECDIHSDFSIKPTENHAESFECLSENNSNSPPLKVFNEIYLINHSFLFYG